MKIGGNITVTIKDEKDGLDAVLTFKKPKYNRIIKLQQAQNDDITSGFFMLTEDLISVTGLQHEDGSDVTKEEINSLDLPIDFIGAVMSAYSAAAYPKRQEKEEEKKTS
jgi:hypothetical protein